MVTGLLALFLAAGCAKSDDQKDFEDQAFGTPQGITATDANGAIQSSDPEDWRISPLYQGRVSITSPAYPNPVAINSQLYIIINILGIEAIQGLEIYVYKTPGQSLNLVRSYDQSSISEGDMTIILNPAGFSGTGGLYRVLIYDNQENLVTYGDVMVE